MKFLGRTLLPASKARKISGRISGQISEQTSEKISETSFQISGLFSETSFSRRAVLRVWELSRVALFSNVSQNHSFRNCMSISTCLALGAKIEEHMLARPLGPYHTSGSPPSPSYLQDFALLPNVSPSATLPSPFNDVGRPLHSDPKTYSNLFIPPREHEKGPEAVSLYILSSNETLCKTVVLGAYSHSQSKARFMLETAIYNCMWRHLIRLGEDMYNFTSHAIKKLN